MPRSSTRNASSCTWASTSTTSDSNRPTPKRPSRWSSRRRCSSSSSSSVPSASRRSRCVPTFAGSYQASAFELMTTPASSGNRFTTRREGGNSIQPSSRRITINFLGPRQARRSGRLDRHPGTGDHRVHRPLRLRQNDFAAQPRPAQTTSSTISATKGISASMDKALHHPSVEVISLRQTGRHGLPEVTDPFPKTIYENVVFSLRVAGRNGKAELDEVVERSLRGAALWDEVKDKLHESAYGLSGGQRTAPMHRPRHRQPAADSSDGRALRGSRSGRHVEDRGASVTHLKDEFTIVIVTHNMQQATRVSDQTAYFYVGRLVEHGPTTMQPFSSAAAAGATQDRQYQRALWVRAPASPVPPTVGWTRRSDSSRGRDHSGGRAERSSFSFLARILPTGAGQDVWMLDSSRLAD